MPTPTSRIHLRVFASFGVALIVIVTGWVSAGALTSGMAARDRLRERRKISDAVDAVYVNLLDSETGQRGYLLTMDKAYLAPYARAIRGVDPARKLYEQVRSNDVLRPVAAHLMDQVTRKRAELAETLRIADTEGVDRAIRVLNAGLGKQLSDNIRADLGRISSKVEQDRDASATDITEKLVLARAVVLSGTLLAFALAVVVNLGLMRAIREREGAQFVVEQQAEQLRRQTETLLKHELQLGDQLLRQQELSMALQRSNEELDQFAYATSHDLKAPLRGIMNLAIFIEEDLGDTATPEVAENLRLLSSRARRLEALIEGILAYARAGRVGTKSEVVDTGALVREVVELIAVPAGCDIALTTPLPNLVTERMPLQQVFMNLIQNAVKHGCGNDQGRVEVSSHRDAAVWHFSVKDFGPGIPAEFHSRIFAVFQTLASRDQIEGTGIGLAVVKKLVESRGGIVKVTSAPGTGARFDFTWPTGMS